MEDIKRFHHQCTPVPLFSISEKIGATPYKNGKEIKIQEDILVNGIGEISNGTNDQIGFVDSKKYIESLKNTNLLACIATKEALEHSNKNLIVLVVENPGPSYAKAAGILYPAAKPSDPVNNNYYISPSAKLGENSKADFGCYIGDNVTIGKNVKIHQNTYIGANVTIGDNSIIYSNVTLQHTHMGNNVIVHPGTRIGQDGFGYKSENGNHLKVPQIGGVVIGNNVEIGSNTCIDRGALGNTIIQDGCKLDNLVQIGHNVRLGKGCIIISHVGIAGSTELGDYVVVAGQSGIAGHLKIEDRVQIAAKSGIASDILEKGQVVMGYPAKPIKRFWREEALMNKLLKNKIKND